MITILKVDGMSCSHCSNSITKALMKIGGVENVEINLTAKTVKIICEDTVSIDALKQAIEQIGFDVI